MSGRLLGRALFGGVVYDLREVGAQTVLVAVDRAARIEQIQSFGGILDTDNTQAMTFIVGNPPDQFGGFVAFRVEESDTAVSLEAESEVQNARALAAAARAANQEMLVQDGER
ncbi:hypothetical protein FJZ36_03955 [Candidatus Poribacteria bacterium]|nr:hypothetical protein [Candidatus Poribacteria bacterium]